MNDESKNRENLKFTDVEKLSKHIDYKQNEALTGEIGFRFYRMDKILKDYANFPLNKKVHALFEHGIILTDYINETFRAHEYLPSIVGSSFRADVLKNQKYFNGAYAIGPYIHYAKPLLTKEEFKIEKERLGKTLLVFPSHSTDGLISNFDIDLFCTKIKKLSSDFDSVRICMYFKDINLKRHEIYKKNGFEVVTAGHLHDYNFIRRLRSIIETSDMTISNEIGSHLGYCIYLNKPHHLIMVNESDYVGEKGKKISEQIVKHEKKSRERQNKSDNIAKIKKEFSIFDEKISKPQYEIISYLWGFNDIKTPAELNNIFLEIEEYYSPIKYYLSGLTRLKDILHERYL